MQLPEEAGSFWKKVQFGQYVVRRLRRADFNAQADANQQANDRVKIAGRAWEDATLTIQNGYAERDAADDGLDTNAQTIRRILASRSADATATPPYTTVFPDGINYYTKTPIDQEVARYQELVQRLQSALKPEDAVLADNVPLITAGIADYTAALAGLQQSRINAALVRAELDAASDDWARQMERTYGFLVGEAGKKAAENFFPRRRQTSGEEQEAPSSGEA